jgi:hypothetical protein
MWHQANKHIKIKGENDVEMTLSETSKDVVAHQRLDESGIETRIEISSLPEMAQAQRLLDRIRSRDFYVKLYTLDRKSDNFPDTLRKKDNMPKDKWAILEDFTLLLDAGGRLTKDDFTVIGTKITTGMTGKKMCIAQKTYIPSVE